MQILDAQCSDSSNGAITTTTYRSAHGLYPATGAASKAVQQRQDPITYQAMADTVFD
jgi:hypothetical protein